MDILHGGEVVSGEGVLVNSIKTKVTYSVGPPILLHFYPGGGGGGLTEILEADAPRVTGELPIAHFHNEGKLSL